jgi:hypothetical protein
MRQVFRAHPHSREKFRDRVKNQRVLNNTYSSSLHVDSEKMKIAKGKNKLWETCNKQGSRQKNVPIAPSYERDKQRH